jgi:hypothetical protein
MNLDMSLDFLSDLTFVMHRIKLIMATLNFENLEQRKKLDHQTPKSAKISIF